MWTRTKTNQCLLSWQWVPTKGLACLFFLSAGLGAWTWSFHILRWLLVPVGVGSCPWKGDCGWKEVFRSGCLASSNPSATGKHPGAETSFGSAHGSLGQARTEFWADELREPEEAQKDPPGGQMNLSVLPVAATHMSSRWWLIFFFKECFSFCFPFLN